MRGKVTEGRGKTNNKRGKARVMGKKDRHRRETEMQRRADG